MHWIYWMKKQLSTSQPTSKIYRKGVGIMLLNKERKIFVGQRFDKDKSAWQMPQGGIDKGEKSIEALKRELEEETGINKVKKNINMNYLPIYKRNYGEEDSKVKNRDGSYFNLLVLIAKLIYKQKSQNLKNGNGSLRKS